MIRDNRISRRDFINAGAAAAGTAVGIAASAAHGQQGAGPAKPRVVILGFDGVEPSIIEKMLDGGELPNLEKLRASGAYARLQTTIPPQSPTAWTSFMTCKNPGGHGIYDFIRRDPKTYLPAVGTGKTEHVTLSPDGAVQKPASSVAYRKGDAFWSVADRQGLRCKILNLPFAYPPDELENGLMICGLGVPDIRGTDNTFFALSEGYKEVERVSAGMRIPLVFDGGAAEVKIPGARDPRKKTSEAGSYVDMPVRITVDRAAHTVAIDVSGKTLELAVGVWSNWVECAFDVTPHFTVHAITRFYVLEAGEQVRIYAASLQFDPKQPYVPFSSPEQFSGELADRYGLYKTIGWAFDTHALRQDALDEEAFLEDCRRTMAWREQLTLDEIDRGDFDLLVSGWTATDRVGHMFWRFRDPEHPLYDEAGARKYGRALEETYLKMDEIVGKIAAKLNENDLLFVISDHGFGTFRKGFNVNTWLVRNGYAAVKGQTDPETATGEKGFLFDFDWANTKAYAIGLSSMYLNLKGREKSGIVDPVDAEALMQEIKQKLLTVTDPDTGEPIFDAIYTREVYKGDAIDDAPDFSFGYRRAYNNSKATGKGAVPADLFEAVMDKWSGEHASNDMASMPGICFVNRSLKGMFPSIVDLGTTALQYLGAEIPTDFEGKQLV